MVVVSEYVPHEITTVSSPDSSIVVVAQVVVVVVAVVACWVVDVVVDVDVTGVRPTVTPPTVGIMPLGGYARLRSQ
jgi:hypothetical protein